MKNALFALVLLLGLVSNAADVVCSRDLFPGVDGPDQKESITLSQLNAEQTANLIQLIVSNATLSNGKSECPDNASSCYGHLGLATVSLKRTFDTFGRVVGLEGSSITSIESFKTKLGWDASVEDAYTCAWGSQFPAACNHVCTIYTEPGFGH